MMREACVPRLPHPMNRLGQEATHVSAAAFGYNPRSTCFTTNFVVMT